MIIKQLSIFLNNEIGRFTEVTRILAEAGSVDLKSVFVFLQNGTHIHNGGVPVLVS